MRGTTTNNIFTKQEKNLDLLEADFGEDNRLTVIGGQLEGGLITTTGPDTAGIFLPSGTIHATYTLTGGFLCGVTCATAKAVIVVTDCVARELARPAAKGNSSDKQDALSVYNKCLECVFASRQDDLIDQACTAWISHQELFLENRPLINETIRLWLDGLYTNGCENWRCPCRHESNDDSFLEHWRLTHLTRQPIKESNRRRKA